MNDGLKSVGVLILLAVGAAIWQWPRLHQWQIEGDLRDYARATRRADLSLNEKEDVLNSIQHLEDRLAEGQVVGFFRWRYADESVRDLIRGIDHDRAVLIVRELRRVESKMDE